MTGVLVVAQMAVLDSDAPGRVSRDTLRVVSLVDDAHDAHDERMLRRGVAGEVRHVVGDVHGARDPTSTQPRQRRHL
eukprot:622251-Amorphochlora_amoeboformis.AAC.1